MMGQKLSIWSEHLLLRCFETFNHPLLKANGLQKGFRALDGRSKGKPYLLSDPIVHIFPA